MAPQAHTLSRIAPPRRPGRPLGASPLLVEGCVQIDAVALLAKTRGACLDVDARAVPIVLRWTDRGRPRERLAVLPILTTPQPFGGVRRWWQCPQCRRRCGVLLAASEEAPIGCRGCLGARYARTYPRRRRDRDLMILLRGFVADGSISVEDRLARECDQLLAPRRRGVRRGRRILPRAARALLKLRAWSDVLSV